MDKGFMFEVIDIINPKISYHFIKLKKKKARYLVKK